MPHEMSCGVAIKSQNDWSTYGLFWMSSIILAVVLPAFMPCPQLYRMQSTSMGHPSHSPFGVTIDISPILWFNWHQPVFYKLDDACLPSELVKILGN